ncbi:hypothetical protein BKA80DRAFT_258942 [Phyllosticta citrichinensis]
MPTQSCKQRLHLNTKQLRRPRTQRDPSTPKYLPYRHRHHRPAGEDGREEHSGTPGSMPPSPFLPRHFCSCSFPG